MNQNIGNSMKGDDNPPNELSKMNIATSRGGGHRNCLCCLQIVEGSQRCSQCQTALYCSRECQVRHWPMHKNICQDSNIDDINEKLFVKAGNELNQGNRKSIYLYNTSNYLYLCR